MHRAANYIKTRVYTTGVAGVPLGGIDASAISKELQRDSLSYLYSSVYTVIAALNGINQGFYSWSIVQLYYSVFYAARAILAANNISIFYIKHSPYSVLSKPGSIPKKGKGNTHAFVLDTYQAHFKNSLLLSQDIDTLSPLVWLSTQREEVNYKIAQFREPDVPTVLEKCLTRRLELSVDDYISDSYLLYAFDPDHAILAFPLKFIAHADSQISTLISYGFSKADHDSLGSVATSIRLNRKHKFKLF